MKLLYCPICRDVHGIIEEKWRKCLCGQSGGQYNADGMTATVGGEARVFGVGNHPFFDPLFIYLTDEKKRELRQKYYGQPDTDAWWGEYPGDVQIFRVPDSRGPRVEIKVRRKNNTENEVIVTEKHRPVLCDGRPIEDLGSVVVPRNPHFKAKTRWRQNEGKTSKKSVKEATTFIDNVLKGKKK